jgi:hypothetical protein
MPASEIPPRPAVKQPTRKRIVTWVRTRTPRFVRWFVFLFIASLAIPALTKQWNDRKQELQVKEGLLTDISTRSAGAVYGAVAASKLAGPPQREARTETIGNWLRDRAAIEPRFDVYFGQSDAANHWYGRNREANFRDAVLRYIHLACCDAATREQRLGRLKQYLYVAGRTPEPTDEEHWQVLACGPQERCPVDKAYSATYQWLGNQLLYQRRRFLDDLLAANGKGFSTGWRDFVTDLNPLG